MCLKNFFMYDVNTHGYNCVVASLHYRYGNSHPGGWRIITRDDAGLVPVSRQGSNNYSKDAKFVQIMLTDYFISNKGMVPWQYNHVRSTGQ